MEHAREDFTSSQHAFEHNCDDGGKYRRYSQVFCSDSNGGLIRTFPHRFSMSANEGITHASVREFLVKNNGKVKNLDLVHHFRQQLNDPVNKSELCVLLFSISRKRNVIKLSLNASY